MNFTNKDIMDLRAKTGVGMMDCKKALIEADGDMDKAVDILREKGMATSAKRAGKIASQGIVDAYGKDGVYALVEVNCESDFVAKGDQFKAFVREIAQYIVDAAPASVEDVAAAKADLLNETVAKIGEKIVVRRFARYEAEDGCAVTALPTRSLTTSLCRSLRQIPTMSRSPKFRRTGSKRRKRSSKCRLSTRTSPSR